jgi:hypothetical protein
MGASWSGKWIMGWFHAWFDPDYVPDGNPRALMRMAVKAKTTLQRRRAIYGLAHVACSDEMFALLNSLLDDKAVADAAAYALGYNADPRCRATALRLARSGGPLAKEAARGVGFDVRPPAELLQVALTHEVKGAVVEALSGLRAWGTPEALAALETFRQGTARPLLTARGDMEDGDGTWEECESSLFLGQQPSPEQIDRTLRKLSALDPIRCAPRNEALARLRQSFDAPDSTFLRQAWLFLTESLFHIPPGAHYLPRYASDEEGTLENRWLVACEAEAPERRAALRTVLAGVPEGPLKAHLRANAGEPDGEWARDLVAIIG